MYIEFDVSSEGSCESPNSEYREWKNHNAAGYQQCYLADSGRMKMFHVKHFSDNTDFKVLGMVFIRRDDGIFTSRILSWFFKSI